MRKNIFTFLTVCAVIMTVAISGCGSGKSDVISSSNANVAGVAATGAPIQGVVVTLRDASVPTQVRTATTSANGAFYFTVAGLRPPFVLTTTWADAKGTNQLHSFAEGAGRANTNPFSDTVFVAAGGSDSDTIAEHPNPTSLESMRGRHASIKRTLMRKLTQLFSLYGTNQDPEEDEYEADHTGLDALFDDVKITVSNGMITVTNKATGSVIFTASVNNIDAGTFHPENMPGQPGQVDGAALYASNCSSCHSALATSSKKGQTAADIQSAISSNTGGMGSLSTLTALQVQAIATALGATSTPPPPAACTYTYDAWGSCQPNNTQTRGVVSSSPAGCTGTPVVSQSCTYVPPVTTCTSFTYSAWGTCQSNNTQTRTTLTSSPAGCTGGAPVLSQSCTYIDGAALYTQYCSGCHGTSKKGKTVSAIQGAIASNRGGMGSLSNLTLEQITAISTAP